MGSYWYGEETITGDNWLAPKYNDQFTDTVTALGDFYLYNEVGNDSNADGNIVLSESRPDRTLIILNQYETPVEEITVVATKIVCENESDLPNWSGQSINIDDTTASNYVAANSGCLLTSGWDFQWGDQNVSDPGGDHYGEADVPGWTTFGSTNGDGIATTSIDITGKTQIRVREVLQTGYIPFT